jgi:hypothetical protein
MDSASSAGTFRVPCGVFQSPFRLGSDAKGRHQIVEETVVVVRSDQDDQLGGEPTHKSCGFVERDVQRAIDLGLQRVDSE